MNLEIGSYDKRGGEFETDVDHWFPGPGLSITKEKLWMATKSRTPESSDF